MTSLSKFFMIRLAILVLLAVLVVGGYIGWGFARLYMAKQALIEKTVDVPELNMRPIMVPLPPTADDLGGAVRWFSGKRLPFQPEPDCEVQLASVSSLSSLDSVIHDVRTTVDDVKKESLWGSRDKGSALVGLARRIKEYPSGKVVLYQDAKGSVAGVCWLREERLSGLSFFILLVPYDGHLFQLGGRVNKLGEANAAKRVLECIVPP